jgi:plasmid stabilization system protein ParE
MAVNITWSQSALADLDRHHQYLMTIDPSMAASSIQEIVRFGKSLEDNPRRGTPINDTPGLRKLLVPVGKYGYLIHYVLLDEELLILRIYHGRQSRPI